MTNNEKRYLKPLGQFDNWGANADDIKKYLRLIMMVMGQMVITGWSARNICKAIDWPLPDRELLKNRIVWKIEN